MIWSLLIGVTTPSCSLQMQSWQCNWMFNAGLGNDVEKRGIKHITNVYFTQCTTLVNFKIVHCHLIRSTYIASVQSFIRTVLQRNNLVTRSRSLIGSNEIRIIFNVEKSSSFLLQRKTIIFILEYIIRAFDFPLVPYGSSRASMHPRTLNCSNS